MLLIWFGALVGGAGIGVITAALTLGANSGPALPIGIVSCIFAFIALVVSMMAGGVGDADDSLVVGGLGFIFGLFTAIAGIAMYVATTPDAANVTSLSWFGGVFVLVGVIATYLGWRSYG